jgi:O-antigen/teichoic acid export membrane protein/uncharacterized membrane protein
MGQSFKLIAKHEWHQSVLRRGAILLCFTLPAALLNLSLTYSASRILHPQGFGVFYTAITAVNILFAPSVVLNLFFSRFIADLATRCGRERADMTLWYVSQFMAKWPGLFSLLGVLGIVLLGVMNAKFSKPLAVVIILIVYTSYLGESGRIVLQGTHRFIRLGAYTLAWMTIRFTLGLAGLWLFKTIWGGLAGIILSAPAVFLLFFGAPRNPRADGTDISRTLNINRLIPFALSYGVFAALAHFDILVAYLKMQPSDLGVYSASSVLPKGLFMVSLPIVQLAFPLMVGRHTAALPSIWVLLKGLLLTFTLTAIGGAVIMAVSGPVCTGSHGIAACDSTTMTYALGAIVVFCVVRFLISADFAAYRDWMPTILLAPLALFGLYALRMQEMAPVDLARAFCLFSLMTLLFYASLRTLRLIVPQWRLPKLQERPNE